MEPATSTNPNRLLVLDDDLLICDLLQSVGEAVGYIVKACTHASDFQSTYPTFLPSLILLDLSLPEEDGVEILRFLGIKQYSGTIIFFSGVDEKIQNTATRLGKTLGLKMALPLSKPCSIEVLSTLLKQYKTDLPTEINLTALDKAFKNKEFTIYYQPKISIKTNRVTGAEALIRWQSSPTHLVFPDAFIPLMESSGFIKPLTYWIIEEVYKQQLAWQQENIKLLLNINLSATILDELHFPDTVHTMAKQIGITPQSICFEITESTAMARPHIAMDILTRLRLKGFALSMDDFGTGFSSLTELYKMPFNELKIDKAFIFNIHNDPVLWKIVRTIINLGHDLEQQVVAEGVETAEILQKLEMLGCDMAQGYYYSKPIPADDFKQWYLQYGRIKS